MKYFPKTLKFTATYLERIRAYQLIFSILFYIWMLPLFLLSKILMSIWMRFLSLKEFTVLSRQIWTYQDLSFFPWHNLLSAVWYNKNKVFTVHYCCVVSVTCFCKQLDTSLFWIRMEQHTPIVFGPFFFLFIEF